MPAESTRKFEALEKQAQVLRDMFIESGYEHVAPSIIQPAQVFLERIGEALRGRTYVFSDPDGNELCLRPDLTVPACRLYLERDGDVGRIARYFYNGPAFRFSPQNGEDLPPREFRQAGIEDIGDDDLEKAESRVVGLAVKAVRTAGLENFRLRLGDLGLFEALLDALEMPDRWRQRLKHHFWRPRQFRELLIELAEQPGNHDGDEFDDLLKRLGRIGVDEADRKAAESEVSGFLAGAGMPVQGTRTLAEVTGRLMDRAADAKEEPLSGKTIALIEDYLCIVAPPKAARARIADIVGEAGIDFGRPLKAFERRLKKMEKKGVDLHGAEFQAEFGRDLEYYTGFVFQIEVPDLGKNGQIAGGGRYDTLIANIGDDKSVPAVGCAIHTERLLAAVHGELT